MPNVNGTPVEDGVIDYGWYGPYLRRGRIIEKVSADEDTASVTLTQQLPARCKVLAAAIKNATALTLASGDTSSTADGVALVNALPTGTSTSSSAVLITQTTTSKNDDSRGASLITANATDSPVSLHVLPVDSGGSQYFSRNTSAATSGMHFSADTDMYVYVEFEELLSMPDAA